jgi:hypothetical protein
MRTAFKKFSSLLTLIAFLGTQFSASAYAQPAFSEIPSGHFNMTVPQEFGTLEDLISGHGPAIVHIQTAHGNFEAQKNIQAILHHLKKNYGIKTLFVEGSAFKLHPEMLRLFPEMPLNQAIAEDLAKRALVQGPELFLLEEKDAEAYGIEEAATYGNNLDAFKSVLLEQQKTGEFLRELDLQIERLTSPYLNKDLRAFLKRQEDFERNQVPMPEWLSYLMDAAAEHLKTDLHDPIHQLDWPMMTRLAKLQQFEKQLDPKNFTEERAIFLRAIEKIPAPLHTQIEGLLSGPLSQTPLPAAEIEEVFEGLVKALPQDFDYGAYPNVSRFAGHLLLQSELNGAMLMEELDRLEDSITQKLSPTSEEKAILELLKKQRLLKRLFALELSPADYEKISAALKPSRFIPEFKQLNSSKRVRDIQFQHLNEMDVLFEKSLEFYRLAKLRDGLMLENLNKLMTEKGIEKAAVITGGFHAAPFKDYFEGRGFNYALISPRVSGADGREAYVKSILQTRSSTLAAPFYAMQNAAELKASGLSIENIRYFLNALRQAILKRLGQTPKAKEKAEQAIGGNYGSVPSAGPGAGGRPVEVVQAGRSESRPVDIDHLAKPIRRMIATYLDSKNREVFPVKVKISYGASELLFNYAGKRDYANGDVPNKVVAEVRRQADPVILPELIFLIQSQFRRKELIITITGQRQVPRSETRLAENSWNQASTADAYTQFAKDDGYNAANHQLLSKVPLSYKSTVVDLGSGTGSGSYLLSVVAGCWC